MNTSSQYRRRRGAEAFNKGFTLVEILVVLAVVAILSAILFSVFSKVREKGRSTVCQSNLKQIALAVQQYVQDSDGQYPVSMSPTDVDTEPATLRVWWHHRILPYVKNEQILKCPTHKPTYIYPSGTQYGYTDGVACDYSYNGALFNYLRDFRDADGPHRIITGGKHESVIEFPATIWLNGDRVIDDSEGRSASSPCGGREWPIATLHNGGGNYSFADGHVKWLTPEGLLKMECENGPTPLGPVP